MARKSKGEVELAIRQLKGLVESGQIFKYNEADLAKKLGFTEKTVRGYMRDIKSELGSRSLESITIDFMEMMDQVLGEIKKAWSKALEEGTEHKILQLTDRLFKAWEKYALLLEKFGIKPTEIQRVDVRAEVTEKRIIVNMPESVKGLIE